MRVIYDIRNRRFNSPNGYCMYWKLEDAMASCNWHLGEWIEAILVD